VELRDRLCLHDYRTVAHDAVAVTVITARMNSNWFRRVSRSATFWSPNHIVVIHPHWG
jgi:hypothetical protein